MAAAIHMFCTLQEAAQRLHTSAEQIETMIQRGILREFREGPHRLLKAADVALLAPTLLADRSSSPVDVAEPSAAMDDREVRLPRCAAVATEMHGYGPSHPRVAGRTPPGRMPGAGRAARGHEPGNARPRTEQAPLPHFRVPTRAAPLSVREWLWTGLTQDRPLAILLLFGLAGLALTAVVAGIYLAARVL